MQVIIVSTGAPLPTVCCKLIVCRGNILFHQGINHRDPQQVEGIIRIQRVRPPPQYSRPIPVWRLEPERGLARTVPIGGPLYPHQHRRQRFLFRVVFIHPSVQSIQPRA